MVTQNDFNQAVRVQIMANEYQRASDNLNRAQYEYEDEARVFKRMKVGIIPMAILTVIAVVAFSPNSVKALKDSGVPLWIGIPVFILVLLAALVMIGTILCFIPAGFIGFYRALGRSGWFVWGGSVVMAVIFALLIMIPLFFGVFFFIGQFFRVRKARRILDNAEAYFVRYREYNA